MCLWANRAFVDAEPTSSGSDEAAISSPEDTPVHKGWEAVAPSVMTATAAVLVAVTAQCAWRVWAGAGADNRALTRSASPAGTSTDFSAREVAYLVTCLEFAAAKRHVRLLALLLKALIQVVDQGAFGVVSRLGFSHHTLTRTHTFPSPHAAARPPSRTRRSPRSRLFHAAVHSPGVAVAHPRVRTRCVRAAVVPAAWLDPVLTAEPRP